MKNKNNPTWHPAFCSWVGLFLASLVFCSTPARADLSIDITTSGGQQIPIAVLNFAQEPKQGETVISHVVGADLARSGQFALVDGSDVSPLPANETQVSWDQWTQRNALYLVLGKVTSPAKDQLQIDVLLLDVAGRRPLESIQVRGLQSQMRMLAHHVADRLYQKITGDGPMFASRVAYILREGQKRTLMVADSDGFNPQRLFATNEPMISPRWSPDGSKLAYVSFELGKPVVVVQTMSTGQRKVVAHFKGNNSAPAWSPDGKTMVVTLTQDGGANLYLIPAEGGTPRQITKGHSISTEAVFTPDGGSLYYVSDREGGPQIFLRAISAEGSQRVSYGSSYCVSPRVSPDGSKLAYVSRSEGTFHLVVQDIASGQVQVPSDTGMDESPSFAPNGKYLLYATRVQGKGILAIVSVDGKIRQRISSPAGDVVEPVWGPLIP
jgi:TolB protein